MYTIAQALETINTTLQATGHDLEKIDHMYSAYYMQKGEALRLGGKVCGGHVEMLAEMTRAQKREREILEMGMTCAERQHLTTTAFSVYADSLAELADPVNITPARVAESQARALPLVYELVKRLRKLNTQINPVESFEDVGNLFTMET